MMYEGLGEMFEGDSADTSAEKISTSDEKISASGWAEGLVCADPGARTPIGASRFKKSSVLFVFPFLQFDFDGYLTIIFLWVGCL